VLLRLSPLIVPWLPPALCANVESRVLYRPYEVVTDAGSQG